MTRPFGVVAAAILLSVYAFQCDDLEPIAVETRSSVVVSTGVYMGLLDVENDHFVVKLEDGRELEWSQEFTNSCFHDPRPDAWVGDTLVYRVLTYEDDRSLDRWTRLRIVEVKWGPRRISKEGQQ